MGSLDAPTGLVLDAEGQPASSPTSPLPIRARLARARIGPLPLPVYMGLAAITIAAIVSGRLPSDLIGGLSVMLIAGFLLGEVGGRTPILKDIGGTAILCLFVPAAVVGNGLIGDPAVAALKATFKTANLQYLYIACLVAGSILGMRLEILVQGFLKMFLPLAAGTIAAVFMGILAGELCGIDAKHTFFFILVPIVGGGLAEGVLPLSLAYSEILRRPQEDLIALMVPAALLGNMVAIVASGLLHRLGKGRLRAYNGNGKLVPAGLEFQNVESARLPLDLRLMGGGLILSCALFLLGIILAPLTGVPAPILMIVAAVALKLSRLLPSELEEGAYQMHRFMATNLTFGILVCMGSLLVSWDVLVSSITLPYLLVCLTTVCVMTASGFFVGLWLKMWPIETAIVTACHSGLGGTGDVAILSASERMELMPFAQIATRIGGALMIVLATFLLKIFH